MAVSGFGSFLAKELTEIRRTWRMWVVPGVILFMGLSSPIIAQITPALVTSLTGQQPGLVINVPEPIALDSYMQWLKNLTQLVLFAIIIAGGGLMTAERRSGTAVMVLTKPVSRSAFVVAKTLSETMLLAVSTVVGAAICWALTLTLFGEAPLGALAAGTALWLLFAAMILALVIMLSVALNSQAGAAGLALVAYLSLSFLSNWSPARSYTPAGLLHAMSETLAGGSADLLWPALTAAAFTLLLVALAVAIFRRQEL